MSLEPYIIEEVVTIVRKYNPDYGDDRVCECGHAYYRHFDSYDNNYACGCKYCICYTFKEKDESQCFSVIDEDGKVIDQSSTRSRAEDRLWELTNEDPNYSGKNLKIARTLWNASTGEPLEDY